MESVCWDIVNVCVYNLESLTEGEQNFPKLCDMESVCWEHVWTQMALLTYKHNVMK